MTIRTVFTESTLWNLNRVISSWNAKSEKYFFKDREDKLRPAYRKHKHVWSKKECEDVILSIRNCVVREMPTEEHKQIVRRPASLRARIEMVYHLASLYADKAMFDQCVGNKLNDADDFYGAKKKATES